MTDNDLQLLVGLRVDTASGQKQVAEFKKQMERTTVNLSVEGGGNYIQTVSKHINDLGQSYRQLNTILKDANGNIIDTESTIISTTANYNKFNKSIVNTTTSIERYRNANNELITTTTKVNANQETIVTTVREYTDAQGRLAQQTTVYNQTQNQTISNDTRIIEDLEQQRLSLEKLAEQERLRMADTSKVIAYNKEWYNGHRALVTTTTELTKTGEVLTTKVTQYKNELGQTVTVTDKFDASGKQVQGTMTEISNKAKVMGQSFNDIIAKVAKFYLASLPIRAVQTVITDTISTVKDFDKAITELRKVADSTFTGATMDNYIDRLSELGSTVARTTTEMIEAVTEFKKAGFTLEDSAILAQVSAKYQNTADEILSASDASSVIISQMKAFNMTASESIQIVDSINQVSQDFAVSSGDIGRGLTQAGAALSTYGNSFDETVGLITAGEVVCQLQIKLTRKESWLLSSVS